MYCCNFCCWNSWRSKEQYGRCMFFRCLCCKRYWMHNCCQSNRQSRKFTDDVIPISK